MGGAQAAGVLAQITEDQFKRSGEEWTQEVGDKIKAPIMNGISKDEATLLTAEGAFEFLFDELENISSDISTELLRQLKEEILKRRNKPIVSLLKFLQDPDCLNESKNSYFATGNKKEIITTAAEIWKKYFCFDSDNPESRIGIDLQDDNRRELSATERLEAAIEKRTQFATQGKETDRCDADKIIKMECNSYASTKTLPPSLKKIYESLLLIKPTSIKNEQNFSMSGIFLTNKRKRMNVQTLDDLCVLKSHFINKYK